VNLFFAVVILIVCLVVLLIAGDKFVDSSVVMAKKLKIPQAVIGATLVSLGTTLPEILVTIFSIKEKVTGIAVGNAVGSIIFNSALIGGVLLLFSKIATKKQKGLSPILLIFSLLLLGIMCLNKTLGIFESILLLVIFIVFVIINYIDLKRSVKNEDDQNDTIKANIGKQVIIFLLSTVAIGVSAHFMVEEAKFIAAYIGISDTFIGLIIVAIGTSLPELITTINAIRKKQPNLGIGNIVGSNIINCTLLLGLTGAFSVGGLEISKQTLFISVPVSLVCCALFLLPYYVKGGSKKYGITLLSIYVLYYIYLILSAIGVLGF